MTRVLLINEPFVERFCRTQRWAARTRGRVLRPPDWLAYATATLELDGHQVKLLDAVAEEMTKNEVYEYARGYRPDMIALDSTTPSIYSDVDCAKNLKKATNATMIMVGPHASALPHETLQMSNGGVDAIAKGEYECTLRELAEAIEGKMCLRDIKGLTYAEESQIRDTGDRPYIKNLDELPFPAWHQLDLRKYYNSSYLNPFTDIVSGRGCPYRCTFCLWPQVMHGRKYRFRSAKNVVDELQHDSQSWPFLREIFFEDDTLTANRKLVREICDEILRRKLDITWSCNSRCDVLDLELLRRMRKAGCRMLLIGPESGCQQILDNIKKGLTLETIRTFVRLAKKAGLQLHACYVIGLPGETRETIRMTFDLANELNTDQIQVSAAIPFPGTEFYDWAVKEGYLRAYDWDEYLKDGEQTSVVEYPWLSGNEINRAVDELLFDYYKRPRHIFQLLTKTKDASDLSRKVKGALSLLDYYRHNRRRKEKRE